MHASCIMVYQSNDAKGVMRMRFRVISKNDDVSVIDFEVRHIINAGYTGRDQKAVQAHVDELKAKGVPAPEKTPVYFVKFAERITQASGFEVLDETDHSGEAEFVMLFDKNDIYIGVGSDHTDRKLETVDIPKAKQIYPNTVSSDLWKLSDIFDHWDQIMIRSWIDVKGEKTLFQEAPLSAMLDAKDLAKRVKKLIKNESETQGLAVYSGTVAALFEADYSAYFKTELHDPVLNRAISHEYTMTPVSSWYKND